MAGVDVLVIPAIRPDLWHWLTQYRLGRYDVVLCRGWFYVREREL